MGINKDYKKYHQVEVSLNKIKYKKFELGVIFSFYLDRLCVGDFEYGLFRNTKELVAHIIKTLVRLNRIIDYEKEIIYFNRGQYRHYKEMVNAIMSDEVIKNQTIIIGPPGASSVCYKEVFFHANLIDFLKVVFFLVLKAKEIFRALEPIELNFSVKSVIFMKLILQLLKLISINKFIEKQGLTKLIASDADRGEQSSLLYAVARAKKIDNFTLQHGVVNGHFGYYPLNANEVWVWGNMAKNQFRDMGAPLTKIRVTGTPIIRKINISSESKKASLQKYNLNNGRTVALALSSPSETDDLELVEFLARTKIIYGTEKDNFIVKVHPARDFEMYSWIENDFGIKVLPQNVPYKDFMNMVDIVLAHTSGIATEALFYDKIVGILDVLKKPAGNGAMLNKYFGVQLLKSPSDFGGLKKMNLDPREIYFKTGISASQEICRLIKNKLFLDV